MNTSNSRIHNKNSTIVIIGAASDATKLWPPASHARLALHQRLRLSDANSKAGLGPQTLQIHNDIYIYIYTYIHIERETDIHVL